MTGTQVTILAIITTISVVWAILEQAFKTYRLDNSNGLVKMISIAKFLKTFFITFVCLWVLYFVVRYAPVSR